VSPLELDDQIFCEQIEPRTLIELAWIEHDPQRVFQAV
jgi:hypothetical protein